MASLSLDTVLITFTWEDIAASLFFITRECGDTYLGLRHRNVAEFERLCVRLYTYTSRFRQRTSSASMDQNTHNYVKMCSFVNLLLGTPKTKIWTFHNPYLMFKVPLIYFINNRLLSKKMPLKTYLKYTIFMLFLH